MSSREEILERAMDALSRIDGIEAELTARRERRLAGLEPKLWEGPPRETEPEPVIEESGEPTIQLTKLQADFCAHLIAGVMDDLRDEIEEALKPLRQEIMALRACFTTLTQRGEDRNAA